MHLALYQPQVPPNTGNIGRLCVGMDCQLHIIGPCGFDFSDKALRRAGLDYWQHLTWKLYPNPEEFLLWLGDRRPWLVTKFGHHLFSEAPYEEDDIIILGNEVRGLPEDWHRRWEANTLHIPMLGPIRAYNLANAAAMVLAQARLRTGRFAGYTPQSLPTRTSSP